MNDNMGDYNFKKRRRLESFSYDNKNEKNGSKVKRNKKIKWNIESKENTTVIKLKN